MSFKPLISQKEWIRAPGSVSKTLLYKLARFWYRRGPAVLTKKFTIPGFALGLLRLSLLISIASLPIIFAKYIAPHFGFAGTEAGASAAEAQRSVANAYWQSGILVVLQIGKLLLDRINNVSGKNKERMQNLSDLSVALGGALGVVEKQITSFAKTKSAAAEIDAFLGHALKCIEAIVKLCMDNMDERYCNVTLLTFEEGGEVKIRARSAVARPVGNLIPRDQTIAYPVAKYTDEAFAVHHYRKAAKIKLDKPLIYKGLSTPGSPPYESILLLPLPTATIPSSNHARKGVVTIDAARPYEFLGMETEIVIRVQAYLDLINLMLTNHAFGVEPEPNP